MRSVFLLFIGIYILQDASAESRICGNSSVIHTRSCSTQILGEGQGDLESCTVKAYPSNSSECKDMVFGPIVSNSYIGGVSLKPYITNFTYDTGFSGFSENYTVLNISFSNIKWKTMKFRFQRITDGVPKNHCRNIVISRDVAVNDQSVLYYDCYWSKTDRNYSGQTHILDFEASDDKYINRGRYYFNIPSERMLSPYLTVEEWKPFTYIEFNTNTMKLHILPPTKRLNIIEYKIDIMKECEKNVKCEEVVKSSTVKVKNHTQEVVYEYGWPNVAGSYYFTVTPLHYRCTNGVVKCQTVESPRVTISSELHQTLNICIASVTALVVAALFAYYIILRVIRRYWCKDYKLALGKEIPTPPSILVVYNTTNKLHAECVSNFVTYLRSEYGFNVLYDCDINNTSHGDPYIWAEEAFRNSTHFLYVVGPAEEANCYNSTYGQPIHSPHRFLDTALLSMLRTNGALKYPKEVLNVFFEHSNGALPAETRHDKSFFLLKDWNKLISFLSKNLLPKQQLMRTAQGKNFLEVLKRAKEHLMHDDIVFKCENVKLSPSKKKVLL